MTDMREEELNDAIEGVLAGQPPTAGDADTLAGARLASHLRGMPSPEFKSRLAAELFPKSRRSILGRITLLNRIKQLASKRIAAPLAVTGALAIAALALTAVVFNPIGGSDGHTAEAFGTLPAPADNAAPSNQGGDGQITWQIDENMVLPDSAPAYRLSMPEVTEARVAQIAAALGVEGDVEVSESGAGGGLIGRDPTPVGYEVGAALDCKPINPGDSCGSSFAMYSTGWFSYRSGEYTSSLMPSDAEAKAAADAWIALTGLTNGDSYELTIQPPPVLPDKPDGIPAERVEPAVAQVIAQPAGHSGPNNGPIIFLTIAGDGTVTDAGGFWASIGEESEYPLHNREQLLADLQALRGTFATLETEFGDVSGADIAADAIATVANVQLEYRQVTPTGDESPDQVYLVPVYVLKTSLGQGEVEDDPQSVNVEACSVVNPTNCGFTYEFVTSVPATGPTH